VRVLCTDAVLYVLYYAPECAVAVGVYSTRTPCKSVCGKLRSAVCYGTNTAFFCEARVHTLFAKICSQFFGCTQACFLRRRHGLPGAPAWTPAHTHIKSACYMQTGVFLYIGWQVPFLQNYVWGFQGCNLRIPPTF
jgi:hypothetical protein